MRDDDDLREAPPTVIGAVAAGVAPLPFLAVYAVLFLVHGSIHPVVPPDITSTKSGELLAGVIVLALLIFGILGVTWFANGRRRWPLVAGQLATLVTSVDFVLDSTTGSPAIPALLVLTSLAALIFAFAPQSSAYYDRPDGGWQRVTSRVRARTGDRRTKQPSAPST